MPTDVLNAPAQESKSKSEASDPVYLKIRDLVYQACGIYHSEEKLYLLAGACNRRMSQSSGQASTPGEYLQLLTSPGKRDVELRALMNEITIGETSTRFWLRSHRSSHRARQLIRCRVRIPAKLRRVPVRARKGRDPWLPSQRYWDGGSRLTKTPFQNCAWV